jgi:hypothetical protein
LLAHLGARHPAPREAAHAFLVYLAGRDLGDTPESWSNWLEAAADAGR